MSKIKEEYNDMLYDQYKDWLAEKSYYREKMSIFKKGWKAAKKMRIFKPTKKDIEEMFNSKLRHSNKSLN